METDAINYADFVMFTTNQGENSTRMNLCIYHNVWDKGKQGQAYVIHHNLGDEQYNPENSHTYHNLGDR